MKYIQKVLDTVGIEDERIAMYNISSAMGAQFAELVREMTERIRKLGPNPLRPAPRTAGRSASSQGEQLIRPGTRS